MTLNLDGTVRNDGKLRADAITEIERPWIDALPELGFLGTCEALVERGVRQAKASAIVIWLGFRGELRPMKSTNATNADYRRVLRSVGPPPISHIGGYINSLAAVA